MKAETWDELWRDHKNRKPWIEPEEGFLDLIPTLKEERVSRTLDLGCGIGRHCIVLAAEGFETYGIDASVAAIEYCRTWMNTAALCATVRHGNMQALSYPDRFFDFVLSWNVIYHTTRQGMTEILAEIERVLRIDGLLYLTLNSTRNKHCGSGNEVEPNTFIDADKADGRHLHHYSDAADARDLLSRFHIESIAEAEQGPPEHVISGSWHWIILARKRTHEPK
jgi:SAM-dependent methyltransferase